MSRKLLVIILLISVAINLAAVFAIGFYWREVRSHKRDIQPRRIERIQDWHESPLRRELNLTEDQLKALSKNQQEMRQKMLPYRQELFIKRKELMELLKKTESNKAQADSLFKEIAALQMELETHVFENLWRIRSMLTPEQRERFEALFHELFEARRPPARPPHHMPSPPGQSP